MKLTADAIHNWTEGYVQRRYGTVSCDVQDAARAAMVRHHQQGTNAQDEADAINTALHLTDDV